jgi:CDP-2,3-bis-(O-geranylgeranyl)-sn-glycerol synthase
LLLVGKLSRGDAGVENIGRGTTRPFAGMTSRAPLPIRSDGESDGFELSMAAPWLILQLTILLAVANGTPVLATKLCGYRFSRPLDNGTRFVDGNPLFGKSKTIRGVVLSILLTALAASVLRLGWTIGFVVGGMAMVGDLFSSFVKRRLNLPPSSRATFLDQVPESLFPLVACRGWLSLSILDIGLCVAIFFFGEVFLSRLLYKAHIRDRPY